MICLPWLAVIVQQSVNVFQNYQFPKRYLVSSECTNKSMKLDFLAVWAQCMKLDKFSEESVFSNVPGMESNNSKEKSKKNISRKKNTYNFYWRHMTFVCGILPPVYVFCDSFRNHFFRLGRPRGTSALGTSQRRKILSYRRSIFVKVTPIS